MREMHRAQTTGRASTIRSALALGAFAAVSVGCVQEVARPDLGEPAAVDPVAPIEPGAPRGPTDPASCDPGSKTLHRLNRAEYDRTVKDLLGVAETPASGFPVDDTAKGFDNNADVLSLSPLLTEKLIDAAHDIAAGLFFAESARTEQTIEAETLTGSTGAVSGEVYNLYANGTLDAVFSVDADGRYNITVAAAQQAAGPDPARMTVAVDGVDIATVDVTTAQDFRFERVLSAGTHTVTAEFINDFYIAGPPAQDRNLLVDRFVLDGPLDAGARGPGADRFVSCDADVDGVSACADATLRPLLRRAFRRPVETADVTPYVNLVAAVVDDGDSFDEGHAAAVEAMLLSPHFLFRVELDDVAGVHRVSDHELATRLSYFIWGTMPDDELGALADNGTLSQRDVLAAQVQRMLADPRQRAGFSDALTNQWLDARSLDGANPDPAQYPLPDDVKEAMKTETKLVVEAIVAADRPATDLLDADFTFVNAALAAHYDMPFPSQSDISDLDDDGDGFIRVSLEGTTRRGVLTHGSILVAHSYPFRTSPVKRGAFVIDKLLCIPPGDIPADAPPLDEENTTGSLRERMEEHRSNPRCAACHDAMDPIGFGLESFGPSGKHRTVDADGYVIDDDDVFFGTAFTDPQGLAETLKSQDTLTGCVVERIGGYALGRGLEPISGSSDFCTITDVVGRATEKGFSWADVVHTIVEADAFQMRRAEVAAATDDVANDANGDEP